MSKCRRKQSSKVNEKLMHLTRSLFRYHNKHTLFNCKIITRIVFGCARAKKQDFETGSLLFLQIKQTNKRKKNKKYESTANQHRKKRATHTHTHTGNRKQMNRTRSSTCIEYYQYACACGTHKSIFISIERNQLAPRHD